MLDEVREISRNEAVGLINRFHYSKVLPRISKMYIGGFKGGNLVAVCTLGWGVRPLHTIKKIFPSLLPKDYFEIGKLCVDDAMPKNTESFFISRVISLVKKQKPELKVLFSWSDGIIGKPGYVYQASNFFYGGYIWTETYLDGNGNRVHPRSLQGLSTVDTGKKFNSRSYEHTVAMGYKKYFGLQFRYVYPLCNNKEWKTLMGHSTVEWHRSGYPKDADCVWQEQTGKGKRQACSKPPFTGTNYVKKV